MLKTKLRPHDTIFKLFCARMNRKGYQAKPFPPRLRNNDGVLLEVHPIKACIAPMHYSENTDLYYYFVPVTFTEFYKFDQTRAKDLVKVINWAIKRNNGRMFDNTDILVYNRSCDSCITVAVVVNDMLVLEHYEPETSQPVPSHGNFSALNDNLMGSILDDTGRLGIEMAALPLSFIGNIPIYMNDSVEVVMGGDRVPTRTEARLLSEIMGNPSIGVSDFKHTLKKNSEEIGSRYNVGENRTPEAIVRNKAKVSCQPVVDADLQPEVRAGDNPLNILQYVPNTSNANNKPLLVYSAANQVFLLHPLFSYASSIFPLGTRPCSATPLASGQYIFSTEQVPLDGRFVLEEKFCSNFKATHRPRRRPGNVFEADVDEDDFRE